MKKTSLKIRGRLRVFLLLPVFLILPLWGGALAAFWADRLAALIYTAVVAIGFFVLRRRVAEEIVDFATRYGSVQKELLEAFQSPYALLDGVGRILWVNRSFAEVTGRDKKYHKSIATILPQVTRELIQREDVTELDVELNERLYRASLRRISFDTFADKPQPIEPGEGGRFLTVLWLFDETDLKRALTENEEQKMISALVYIDNYDEVLENIEDVRQSMLVALVDRKVNQYFAGADALVRKIEKDKYFIVFRNKFLPDLEKDKFSLVEDVKTIKVGKDMSITLSIGIGATGATYAKNYEYAHAAIDLALGRGGDQAVVRRGEEISYFGGGQRELAKNTRVKARVKAHALREAIGSHGNILVMGHSISPVQAQLIHINSIPFCISCIC